MQTIAALECTLKPPPLPSLWALLVDCPSWVDTVGSGRKLVPFVVLDEIGTRDTKRVPNE